MFLYRLHDHMRNQMTEEFKNFDLTKAVQSLRENPWRSANKETKRARSRRGGDTTGAVQMPATIIEQHEDARERFEPQLSLFGQSLRELPKEDVSNRIAQWLMQLQEPFDSTPTFFNLDEHEEVPLERDDCTSHSSAHIDSGSETATAIEPVTPDASDIAPPQKFRDSNLIDIGINQFTA
jgi:hypothetical protein